MPPIPVRDQSNPPATNRQVPAPGKATPSTVGAPVTAGSEQALQDLIRTEIRRALRDGGSPQIVIPPNFVRNAVPQGAVDMTITMFLTIAFVIVGLPLARAFARRIDSKSQRLTSGAGELRPAIEQLQQSVDALAIEMERVTEAQRFQAKLMAERPREPAQLPRQG